MRVTLSLRGDYAVRAMLALAQHAAAIEHDDETPKLLSAARIAVRMRIPGRFVAHVLSDLSRSGLVIGSTGRTGGYRLALPPERIELLQIVDAAEPDGGMPRCVLRGIPCDPLGHCAVHDAFGGATAALRAELARTSLASLVKGSA
ncbi:MAG: Rrf2 family transcriptional regulator [Chloroflexota bacterium]